MPVPIDHPAVAELLERSHVLGANAVLMDAYNTDVRPLLAQVRTELGLDPDPMAAYARSGYAERIWPGILSSTLWHWSSMKAIPAWGA